MDICHKALEVRDLLCEAMLTRLRAHCTKIQLTAIYTPATCLHGRDGYLYPCCMKTISLVPRRSQKKGEGAPFPQAPGNDASKLWTPAHTPSPHTPPHTHTYHIHICASLFRHETSNTEHHNPGKDGGDRVNDADSERVFQGIVVWLGVAGKSNEGASSHTKREEYLSCSLQPYLGGKHLLNLRGQREGRREEE